MEVKKIVVDIYLKGDRKPSFTGTINKEEDLDVFFQEMNNGEPIMEFGDFYFSKEEFKKAYVREIKETNEKKR